LVKGANYIAVLPPATIPATFTYTLPNALPGSTQAIVVDTGGQWSYQAISGAGHTQNTDTGTTAISFQLDSGNSGVRIKNNGGSLELRNAADNARASLLIQDLTVSGTTTTIDSETLTIADNIIVLNNNVISGTPTEDGGVQVRRGASVSASMLWDETNDIWKVGLVGSELQVTRIYRTSFTNATLSAGVLTLTHSLGQQYCQVTIYDNSGKRVLPDEETATSTSAAAIDLTSYGTLTGTWNAVVVG
jgi:hypothetical protein